MTDSVLAAPEITPTVDGYRITWVPLGIEATAEWVEQKGRELTCELTVRSTRPMSEGLLLAPAAFNLSAPQTRKNLARQLADRDGELDWDGMIEQLVIGVRERHRLGEPTIDMRSFKPSGAPIWHLHPFLVTSGPTVVFGDGGVGKTSIAIAIAASAASGSAILGLPKAPPQAALFLDYEGSAETFYARLAAVCVGAGIPIPPVHYRREYASLTEAAPAIRREVERNAIGTVVIDSVGLACGGSPEAADVTLGFFRAVDSLRVPALLIDHITKNGGPEQTKAYGSVYKHNRPRLAWKVVGRQDADGKRIVALTEHKHNDFKELPRLGYRISYITDHEDRPTSIEIGWADVKADPELGSLRDRIVAELARQPQTRSELADTTGAERHILASRVSEMVKRGELRADEEGRLWVVQH